MRKKKLKLQRNHFANFFLFFSFIHPFWYVFVCGSSEKHLVWRRWKNKLEWGSIRFAFLNINQENCSKIMIQKYYFISRKEFEESDYHLLQLLDLYIFHFMRSTKLTKIINFFFSYFITKIDHLEKIFLRKWAYSLGFFYERLQIIIAMISVWTRFYGSHYGQ